MSNNQDHGAEITDLTSRLGSTPGWFGVAANPSAPDAVPVIFSEWFGLIDSLTWARHAVKVKETSARWLNLSLEELFAGDNQYADDTEDWEIVSQPLADNPTPHLLAVAVVALQRLGVEVGREAIAHGINPDRPSLSGIPFDPDPTIANLWDWVTRRWTTPPAAEDTDLRPDRALHLNLAGEAGLSTVLALVLHIARITVADRDSDTHLYAATHPQLAVADGGRQGGPGWDPTEYWRARRANHHPAGPDEDPPF